MVMTDPIADMLTRIRNANVVRHGTVDIPASNMKRAIANIMLEEGFIKNYEDLKDGSVPILRESVSQDLEYMYKKMRYQRY